MRRPTIRIAGAVLPFFLVLAGCAGTPERVNVKSLQSRSSVERWAKKFWDVVDSPKASGAKKPKVAIAEFSINYVGNTQDSATQDVNLSRGLAVELPSILYQAFVDTMLEFDAEAIPLESVSESAAYARLQGTQLSDIDLVEGNITDYTYPVDGLRVIQSDQSRAQEALTSLLAEVGADTVLQVRLKVGLHGGHAVIAKGSTFRVTNKHGTGLLKSKMAVISEGPVLDRNAQKLDSSTLHINSAHFTKEVQEVFRPYISMALHVTK